MTRAQGFNRGDLDTSFPLDDKFLDLRRQPPSIGDMSPEAVQYYAATGVFFHIVAATWREAERKPGSRVAPDALPAIAVLASVGLLDTDGRVSNRAFTNFIGRARRQRKAAAERQSRNRAEKSRGVTRDERVTNGDSAPLRSAPIGTAESSKGVRGNPKPKSDRQKVHAWLMEHDISLPSGWVDKTLTELAKTKGAEKVIAAFEEARESRAAVTVKNYVTWAEQTLAPDPARTRRPAAAPKGFQPTDEEVDSAFVRE